MIVAPFKVILDANVLYPFTVRDTLLRATALGLYQAYWSDFILDEVERNLTKNGVMDAQKAQQLRGAMTDAFPEAAVSGFEALIDAMPNDDKDRHVAAAAVKAGAQVIVTNNVKDFEQLPDGIEVQTADEFLSNLYDLDPETMHSLVKDQAEALKKPPVSHQELVEGLRKTVPEFADLLTNHSS